MIKEDFPLVLPLAFTQTALQRSVEYRQLAIEGSPTACSWLTPLEPWCG